MRLDNFRWGNCLWASRWRTFRAPGPENQQQGLAFESCIDKVLARMDPMTHLRSALKDMEVLLGLA